MRAGNRVEKSHPRHIVGEQVYPLPTHWTHSDGRQALFWGGGMRSSRTCTLGSWTKCGAYPHSLQTLQREDRLFWQTAPSAKASSRVQREADKALLALKIWQGCPSEELIRPLTKSPLENKWDCWTLLGHNGGCIPSRERPICCYSVWNTKTAIWWLLNSNLFRDQTHNRTGSVYGWKGYSLCESRFCLMEIRSSVSGNKTRIECDDCKDKALGYVANISPIRLVSLKYLYAPDDTDNYWLIAYLTVSLQ